MSRAVSGRIGLALLPLLAFAGPALAQQPPPPPAVPAVPPVPPVPVAPAVPVDPAERLRLVEERLAQIEAERRAEKAQRELEKQAEAARAKERGADLRAVWKDAFWLESDDASYRLRISSLLQVDGRAFLTDPPAGNFSNFSLRSARIVLEGSVTRYIDFRINVDFSGGRLQIPDGTVELRLWPQLRIRAGKIKVPFGLERQNVEGRTAFMERGFPTSISPNRDIGVMVLGEAWNGLLV